MIAELKQSQDYLKEQGVENAHAEAELIFRGLLGCGGLELYTQDTKLDILKKHDIHIALKRRVTGEPLQYILGRMQFYGLEFKMREGVFIPRPETELLVEAVVNKLSTLNSPLAYARDCSLRSQQLSTNLLDLCTGCGNIAISLTKKLTHYKIFVSDICGKAISLAKENAEFNSVSNNIEFRQGDLFKCWRGGFKTFFDIIVCNPPYIKTAALSKLPKDVQREPTQALDGGLDGLYFYRKICKQALFYLKENGFIFFEISPELSGEVKNILSENFCDIEVIKDYNQLDRIITARKL